jgi:chromosome segregation ATPase
MSVPEPVLSAITRTEERLFEPVDERFAGFRRGLPLDLDGRFDAVHHRLNRLEADVVELKAYVLVMKTDVAVLRGETALLKATVERLDAWLGQERSERADLREQAVEFRHRLGDVDSQVQEIESRLPRS